MEGRVLSRPKLRRGRRSALHRESLSDIRRLEREVRMRDRLAAATNAVTGASPSDRGSIDLLLAVQD